jgi:chromosomal replication initiator protein
VGEERVVDKQRLWQNVLGEAEVSLSKANFNTWLKNTEIVDITDTEVLLRVPNVFTLEWLQKKYEKELRRCLTKSLPNLTNIKYMVGGSPKQEQATLFSAPMPISSSAARISTATKTTTPNDSIERLNQRYTFETFVVGESNKLANAAANAVAKTPGITYNPLFIYGGVGLGKTHLLQAVGNEILTLYPKKKVVYITSERFTNELVDAIHKKTTKEFREKYRKADCLIIDDIQFLAGREATQEEFFNTFNTLYESNKQIILASDRPPKAIPTLESRLRSRFEWGMIADISAPNYEMRLAVLRSKASNLDFQLPDYILEAIAGKIQNNIRELEGALTRVVAYGQLNNTIPTNDEVENLLGGILFSPGKRIVKVSDVVKAICKHYDIKKDELLGKKRNKEIVFPRQVLIFLLREELDLPYKSIGRELGGKDHTTIIHDYNKIKNLLMESNDLESEIKTIKDKLYAVD